MRKSIFSFLLVFVSFISTMTYAGFAIDHTGSDQSEQGGAVTKKKLLLDKSVVWARFLGNCSDASIQGSGLDVPMSFALKMILPTGWKVYSDDDVSLEGIHLTWKRGDLWTKLLSDVAEKNKIRITIDCNVQELSLAGSPDLGSLAETGGNTASFESIPQPDPEPAASVSLPAETIGAVAGSSAQSAQSRIQTLTPFTGESVYLFMNRYAELQQFDRVVYRIRDINKKVNLKIDEYKRAGDSDKSFSLGEALASKGLIALNAKDVFTGRDVLVVTDEMGLNNRQLRVFRVDEGALSINAVKLATIYSLTIGSSNQWPLETDYNIKFRYDIVIADSLDAFSQLFKSYPVQAQIIHGGTAMTVVKRTTANRQVKN